MAISKNVEDWFFLDEQGAQSGPHDREELLRRWRAGQLTVETFVWTPGMEKWTVFRLVFPTLAPPPTPPIRPTPTPNLTHHQAAQRNEVRIEQPPASPNGQKRPRTAHQRGLRWFWTTSSLVLAITGFRVVYAVNAFDGGKFALALVAGTLGVVVLGGLAYLAGRVFGSDGPVTLEDERPSQIVDTTKTSSDNLSTNQGATDPPPLAGESPTRNLDPTRSASTNLGGDQVTNDHAPLEGKRPEQSFYALIPPTYAELVFIILSVVVLVVLGIALSLNTKVSAPPASRFATAEVAPPPGSTRAIDERAVRITCEGPDGSEVHIALAARVHKGIPLNCIEGDFVYDSSGCAPMDGFALHAPTGTAPIGELVGSISSELRHTGMAIGSWAGPRHIDFNANFLTGGEGNPPKFEWYFRATLSTGVGQLITPDRKVNYRCQGNSVASDGHLDK